MIENFLKGLLLSLLESVDSITIRTPEMAACESNKDTRKPGESAFPLQAEVDLVDHQCIAHADRLAVVGL